MKKPFDPKVDQNHLDEMLNTITVESLFSTFILLDTYLSPDIITKAKTLHNKTNSKRTREGLLQGYKLIIVATIDSYINSIVRSPDILGIEPDPDYHDYWSFTKGRGREVTRSAARSNHYISQFVEKANSLIKSLIGLRTWDGITAFEEQTRAFRNCLKAISEKGYSVSKNGKEIPIGTTLREASNRILWSTSGDPTPIAHMYTDYFISRKTDDVDLRLLEDMAEECDPKSGVTRLDYSEVSEHNMPRPLPPHWALGYAFSLHESLKQLARNKKQERQLELMDDQVLNIKNWLGIAKYSRKLDDVYGIPSVYSGYDYKRRSTITDKDRKPLTKEVESSTSPERLLSILGNRARIVEGASTTAYLSFCCLLDGAIKRSHRTKEKAKIALVVHKLERGQEDYSAAIFMPSYGLLSNASMWWVFYYIGNNHSGGSSSRMKQVLEKIKRNRSNLDVMIVKADRNEFYEYCEDPGYVRLEKAITLSNKVVGDIRGTFPELLLANMLTNMGYAKVLNRYKPNILKKLKGELDVVGIKFKDEAPSHILIFESKGQATDERELQKEINRFSDNVEIIRSQLKTFCNELQLPSTKTPDLEAVFVSMAELKTGIEEPVDLGPFSYRKPRYHIPGNIKLWDFNDLISNLSKCNVPLAYQQLLKQTQIAVII